jgi:hypothetical protein
LTPTTNTAIGSKFANSIFSLGYSNTRAGFGRKSDLSYLKQSVKQKDAEIRDLERELKALKKADKELDKAIDK